MTHDRASPEPPPSGAFGEISAPSLFNQLLEGRLLAEAAALSALLPVLRLQSPRGEGPVVVLPGFMADDRSTWLLRRFIGFLGYEVHGWNRGINRGRMLDHLPDVVDQAARLSRASSRKVRLVGWSRGGLLARELARDRPELVEALVTMGTPVAGGPRATSIGAWIERETGIRRQDMAALMQTRQRRPIVTPITAIYSKTDGVVAWQACIDELNPHVTHRAVNASHVGMGCNAMVFREVARALAEPSMHG